MTHSIDAPFPPPPTTSGATSGGGGSPSTTDVAKDEAKNLGQSATQAGSEVASTAAQAGSQVASTAAGQAKEVVQETRQQAMDLLDQGRSQVREQAVTQQQKAAQSLTSLAEELRGMVNGTGTSTSGPAHDLLHQATDKIESFAGWLQNREPADVLNEVRSFARRKPGTFLLGAAIAGVAAGRLTSGVRAAHGDSGGQHRATGAEYTETRYSENYVEPTPSYAPVDEPAYPETTGYAPTTAGTAPVPPPPYGAAPPAGSAVPPATPAGWDDPARRPGGVG